MRLIHIAIFSLLFFFPLCVFPQRYEIGLTAMGTGYMGDLNNSNPFYYKNLGGGLFFKYNLDPTWGIKLSANQLLISGDDKDASNDFQNNRNLQFQNFLSEIALTSEFNFWNYYNSKHKSKFTPYILAGIGLLRHDPYVIYDGVNIKLRPLKLEYDEANNNSTYSNWSIAVPIGLGFKYRINNFFSVGLETSYRIAFTDYIDNVSKQYPTSFPEDISLPNMVIKSQDDSRLFNRTDWEYLSDPSNSLGTNAGSARGDGKNKDGYMTVGFTLTYTIFDRNCYSWIKR